MQSRFGSKPTPPAAVRPGVLKAVRGTVIDAPGGFVDSGDDWYWGRTQAI
jgi:hypothetical protein